MRRKSIYKRGTWDVIRSLLLPVLFTAIIMGLVIDGLQRTEEASRAEGLRILEDGIRRAVVTAYAVEGRYPDTIKHIEDNYGIFIDWDRYIVHYTVFATNIMPNVAVLEIRN